MTEPTTQTKSEQKSDPNLRDLLAPIFRGKRLFALCFCGMVLGTIVAAVFLSSQYQASMEILVNGARLDPVVTSEATSQTPVSPPPVTDEEINSEMELLQSPDLLRQVVIATGLQDLEKKSLLSHILPKQDDAWYIAKATKKLGKKLDIEVVTKTNVIQVNYKNSDPQLAYNVLKKLAAFYLEQHLAVHRPAGSYAFFTGETLKYRQALEESEKRLANFGKVSGVAAPDVEKTELAQQVVSSIGSLHNAEQNVAADKSRIKDLEAQMQNTPARSATQELSASAQTLMQELQANLLAAEIKKTQLAMKYDPSYPLVQEADREIAETRSAIETASKQQYVNQTTDRDPTYELMREDIAKTQADLAFQQANAAAIQESVQTMQNEMISLDQKAIEQADLSRDVKTNEANYLLYFSKREQERTSDALDERRIENVAIAVPPSLPILPWVSASLVMLIGLVLALFVSAGVALVAEYLDPTLRTPAEVVEILRIPVLASVPKQTA
jgi:uncharacterized protein involved in exopolysaccharide biosynthesis